MYRPDSRILLTMLGLAASACLAVSSASAALIDLTPGAGQTNSATSVSLADLISGLAMGITVGDKNFTGFGYIKGGDMPEASGVQVAGLRDADGNWGITFQGAFLDLPTSAGASDASIRFMVEIAPAQINQGFRIVDAHLAMHGAGTGGDESLFLVDETLSNGTLLETYVTTIGPGPQQNKLTDDAVFAGVTKLNVVKDILAIAATGNFLPARATVIDQSFSQEIPEPATMALLGLSSLAIVSFGRRRS